jgi:hypothetical protein
MHVSQITHSSRAVMEPLEAVISIQFSRSYEGRSEQTRPPPKKNVQPLPFYQRRNNERRKRKTKVLTLNKYMAMGRSGIRCQEWPCWLVAGSKILLCCSALLCRPPRSPASRRRRRKWKSRIWDSKIWSRVPRDSDPKMTALARTSSNYKRQTPPLVRDSAPHQQTCNCVTVIKILS